MGQFNVEKGIDVPEWQDKEGYAPLHLSVIGGHPLTTKALLEAEDGQTSKGLPDGASPARAQFLPLPQSTTTTRL